MTAKTRLALDVAMFAALLAAYNPAWTGLAVHEWLSIAIIVPLLFHLIINWEWTVRVASTFIDRLMHASRVNLVVDILLFVSTVAVMLSGLMVSQVALAAFGLAVTPGAIWVALHAVTADTTVFLLGTHFVLHASWVARVLGAGQPAPANRPTTEAGR
ncbi:MAG: DUF4405 domain-containing protein [Coriobacteriia bacterium]|nr:DUF4405 domain-containing protein [Coriobacteriia bacterium]